MSDEELRQAIAVAAKVAAQGWQASQVPDDMSAWDHFYRHLADAVLAAPAIADALARDAKVAEIIAGGGWADDYGPEVAALYPPFHYDDDPEEGATA